MEDLTFWLAVWGAALSTFLALRETRKDKRQLKIILEHDVWADSHRLLLINIGHRPITIETIGMTAMLGGKMHDPVPKGAMWSIEKDQPEFPIVLEDGRMAILYINSPITTDVIHRGQHLDIRVYDAEGNVYSKYTTNELDIKYSHRR